MTDGDGSTGSTQSDGGRYPFVPYDFQRYPEPTMIERAEQFYEELNGRRSVRFFSDEPVSRRLIELAMMAGSTAPSGAHRQPWRFVAVDSAEIKARIREAAEAEERKNYGGGRFPEAWLEALAPLGTTWEKPYLEICPWIVVLFEEIHGYEDDGKIRKNYYVKESVGIAAGMFIAALNHMGLTTLTHTPSPMGFLTKLLGRPKNERPFILFPIGYPVEGCTVPELSRKSLDDIAIWNPEPTKEETP